MKKLLAVSTEFNSFSPSSSSGRWCAKTRPSQNQIIFAILIDLNDIQGAISRRDTANRIQGILIVDEIRHVAASQIFALHSVNNTAFGTVQALYYELVVYSILFFFFFYYIALYFLHSYTVVSNIEIN